MLAAVATTARSTLADATVASRPFLDAARLLTIAADSRAVSQKDVHGRMVPRTSSQIGCRFSARLLHQRSITGVMVAEVCTENANQVHDRQLQT